MKRPFLIFVAAVCSTVCRADDSAAPGLELFEKKIRPLLVERCYSCHGEIKQRGGLRLDNFEAVRAGGDRGEPIVPGDPDSSILIQAVRYTDESLQMPPKNKLSETEIAALTDWVRLGAPYPKGSAVKASSATEWEKEFDARRRHWAYQPVRVPPIPFVKDQTWPRTPIDAFLLARLEGAGLRPAQDADRRTLIRRATFDLIGLPPTPEEVEAFVADSRPDAFERVVSRLLASPHFGERWGRHWLDLVRFAETLGHEFDFEIFNAWRYRDYVVRAFNDDLRYDQFVREHVAGDLLQPPRRNAVDGMNESAIATGFFWFGEGKHSPVDVRQEETDRLDNQIDVFAKTFLAQTIACARCHDHKFDPIRQSEYYSLVGYVKSSRYQQAFLDPRERIKAKAARLEEIKRQLLDRRSSFVSDVADGWLEGLEDFAPLLQAARPFLSVKEVESAAVRNAATQANLEPARLSAMIAALRSVDGHNTSHPLHAWLRLADASTSDLAGRVQELRRRLAEQQAAGRERAQRAVVFDSFNESTPLNWFVVGDTFEAEETVGDVQFGSTSAVARLIPAGRTDSGRLSPKLEGGRYSKTFTLDKRFVHLRMAGRTARVNLVIDGFLLIRSPIYGDLHISVNREQLDWYSIDVSMWRGHRAYLELIDSSTPNLGQAPKTDSGSRPEESYLQVDEILLSDDAAPAMPNDVNLTVLEDSSALLEDIAKGYQAVARNAVSEWTEHGKVTPDAAELLNWLLQAGLLKGAHSAELRTASAARPEPHPPGVATSQSLLDEYRAVEAAIPAPTTAPALMDGTGENEFVLLRGNYRTPGSAAPRSLPEVVAGHDQPMPGKRSGRLELANRLAREDNPLLARVMVNRVWQHLFGRGIVASPDDFGHMGQPPSHPELLDYLADQFVTNRWSIKSMIRLLMNSRAYQMSSRPDDRYEEQDPGNRLWHRMPLRRLEAESIRDALLAVSGRLDRRMYGPSTMPYLTAFMEGRGRPGQSGPLDGDGRRSLYLNVRRNFLTPMFLAFDYPVPFTTMGRRSVSNVPAQALALMNSPFVVQQTALWSKRETDRADDAAERIDRIYRAAFGRPPSDRDLTDAVAFLREQSARYGGAADDARAWTDLCHVLVNTKEFLFLP